MNIDNMGGGKMCLAHIASPKVKYEDQEFIDPITKDKTPYQARVYKDNIKLTSAFWPSSVNSVNVSVWFQEDLPFPGVDLSKLKPKKADKFPSEEIRDYIRDGSYKTNYDDWLRMNWSGDDDYVERCH